MSIEDLLGTTGTRSPRVRSGTGVMPFRQFTGMIPIRRQRTGCTRLTGYFDTSVDVVRFMCDRRELV